MKHFFTFLIGIILSNILMAQVLQPGEVFMLVGTYSKPGADGIFVYAFNTTSGVSRLVSSAAPNNPSFLTVSPDSKFVYAVNENDNGRVTAFSFNKQTGQLTNLNEQSSMGRNPCYIAASANSKWVAVANYSSGSAAILPIKASGQLDSAVSFVKHTGSGINTQRQEAAHAHGSFFSPDGNFLLVPDLGIDKVMVYQFNNATGKLTEASPAAAKLQPGAGPRHLAFHPNGKFVYVVEELAGAVTVFNYHNGVMDVLQRVSITPKNFKGNNGAADIHVSADGKYLYASNRGDANTISKFSIDSRSGELSRMRITSTEGKGPRNFNFSPDEKFLLVANQNSDQIVVFKRNSGSGKLSSTSLKIDVPKPVCIKWISDK